MLASLGDGSPPAGSLQAIDVLDGTDVAIVQHEYGLYDGVDGDAVLDRPRRPSACRSIVVAHTVVRAPTANQRQVLERVVRRRRRRGRDDRRAPAAGCCAGFDVDAVEGLVIPHGAATPLVARCARLRRASRRRSRC